MKWKLFLCALSLFSLESAAAEVTDWQVKNAGSTINTEYHDGWAVMQPDGLTLLFGSNRPGGLSKTSIKDHWVMAEAGGATLYDIYISHRKSVESDWEPPVRLPNTVNSTASDHSASLSPDGHYLIFASDRAGGCGQLDLYISYRKDVNDDQGWGPSTHLGCLEDGGINGEGHDSCPIWRDGTLYFTSSTTPDPMTLDFKKVEFDLAKKDSNQQREVIVMDVSTPFMDAHFDPDHAYFWANYPSGGEGGSDLWRFASRGNGPDKFANPTNLGRSINTAAEEHMPSATEDGSILNFVSDREGGFGGLDIWQAKSID